ncbi:MAG TPA: cytochrome c maturation protein CcmE [Firmicutes bacterium]|nr:cytochrome c maturation protein CcmE [Bacillota bacterium]
MEGKRWAVLLVILFALFYLVVTGWRTAPFYYLTVGELLAEAPRWQEREVRVRGELEPGSVMQWPSPPPLPAGGAPVVTGMVLREGEARLVLRYAGELPSRVRPGRPLVADGRLGKDGVFYAHRLLVQCPSRYDPERHEPGTEPGGERGNEAGSDSGVEEQ